LVWIINDARRLARIRLPPRAQFTNPGDLLPLAFMTLMDMGMWLKPSIK
jgi:hypothetical protein